ncbi:serine/threonine protein kinase [Streptomyces anulatus]|uniref:serine/threonine protein kinase n=1 Tax=Streptomyces anulatus TaxID=1892 RepID=UPI0033D4E7EF
MQVAAGVPPIHSGVHELRTGSPDGARVDFEQMLAQLASATNPNVRMIAANPGDWGIDAFAGDLGGAITVWQSKYFMPKTTTSQSDQEKAHDLVIELWDETTLVKKLQSPEGDQVRRAYYEVFTPAALVQEQMRLVLDVEEDEAAALDSTLFVRRMTEAGHVELDSAKRQFFNADLVAREVAHKGVPAEVAALSSADASLHGVGEMQFNECSSEGTLPALHGRVWCEVRSEHDKLPKALRLEVTHS